MPKFSLIKYGDLAGVVADSAPKELLIIHDFGSGKSWPHQGDETWQEAYKKRDELLEAFNARSRNGHFRVQD